MVEGNPRRGVRLWKGGTPVREKRVMWSNVIDKNDAGEKKVIEGNTVIESC